MCLCVYVFDCVFVCSVLSATWFPLLLMASSAVYYFAVFYCCVLCVYLYTHIESQGVSEAGFVCVCLLVCSFVCSVRYVVSFTFDGF